MRASCFVDGFSRHKTPPLNLAHVKELYSEKSSQEIKRATGGKTYLVDEQ